MGTTKDRQQIAHQPCGFTDVFRINNGYHSIGSGDDQTLVRKNPDEYNIPDISAPKSVGDQLERDLRLTTVDESSGSGFRKVRATFVRPETAASIIEQMGNGLDDINDQTIYNDLSVPL